MTYFWYSYSLYIVLGILFIIWILYNTWIINTLLAIVFVVFIYESYDSYVANKLCSCFPILADKYKDEIVDNEEPIHGDSFDSAQLQHFIDVRIRFSECLSEEIDSLYKNSVQFLGINNENIESGTWNGTPIFHPSFKNIAKLIEQRCPTLAREADLSWEELINQMDNN